MSDDLCTPINKLANDGTNWVAYQDHIIQTFNLWGWSNHLTSTTFPATYLITSIVNSQSPKQQWATEEAIMKSLIMATVPDPILNQIKSKTTTKETWDAIVAATHPLKLKKTAVKCEWNKYILYRILLQELFQLMVHSMHLYELRTEMTLKE